MHHSRWRRDRFHDSSNPNRSSLSPQNAPQPEICDLRGPRTRFPVCIPSSSPSNRTPISSHTNTLNSTAAASIAKTIVIHWTPIDYTWDNSQVGYWGALEHEGGIIVACFPTLRPILQYFQSRFGSGPNSNNRELNSATSWTLRGTTNKRRANSEDELLHDEDDMQIRKMTEVRVSLETREAASRLGDVPNLHWDPSGRNREASSQSAASYGGATTRADVE